jgi:hypothetical protein
MRFAIDQTPFFLNEVEKLAVIAVVVYVVALAFFTVDREPDLAFVEQRFNAMCWVGMDFENYCIFFESGEKCRVEFYCPTCWSKYNCTQTGDLV